MPLESNFEAAIGSPRFELAGALGVATVGVHRCLTPNDLLALDAVLRRHDVFTGVRVDPKRLSESYRTWVHVQVSEPGEVLRGFGPLPLQAVLTWSEPALRLAEPQIHSHIEDGLPDSHALAFESVGCETCGAMLHAGNNECMQTWVETGLGPFCAKCFLQRPDVLTLDEQYALR